MHFEVEFAFHSADNIFAGFQAGNISTPGDNNSFFGVFAGFSNSGISNSFVGSRAGALNASGGRNSFFGADAGDTNVNGVRNIAIGYASDVGSAGLTNATAIGSQARVTRGHLKRLASSPPRLPRLRPIPA